jgi:tetratricopeptide (TPR) repeat protein
MRFRRDFRIMACAIASLMLVTTAGAQSAASAEEYLRRAEAFHGKAQPDDAIANYELAAAGFQQLGNVEKLVHSLNQIGVVLTRQDQYERARKYLDRALATGLPSLGAGSLLVANTYIALGVVYSAEGHFDRSLEMHNLALDIRRARLGEFDASVATSYGNIGNVLFRKREYDRAIEAHSLAMKIRAKVFSPDGPEIVESYRGLGNAYREKKDYSRALEYFQMALANKLAQLGNGHRDLGRFYRYVSEVHGLNGNAVLAEEFRSKADSLEDPKG